MKMFRCKRRSSDLPVISNLALTPSQIASNARNGLPSAANPQPLENYIEGTTDNSYFVPVQYRRGVGASEAWNAQVNARRTKSRLTSYIDTHATL